MGQFDFFYGSIRKLNKNISSHLSGVPYIEKVWQDFDKPTHSCFPIGLNLFITDTLGGLAPDSSNIYKPV